MQCRTCGYGLWNLRARTCPECGAPFAPSQFEFRRSSVAFCCPHCNQAYYGTGPGGHLEPRAFACASCGVQVDEDEMVLRPAEGVAEQRTRVRPIPWLDPTIRSTLLRLVQTALWSLSSPGRVGERLPVPPRTGAAVGYGAALCVVFVLPALVAGVLFSAAFGGLPGGGGAVILTLVFGLPPVVALALIVPWALTAHAVLALGGARQGGLGRTTACLAYAFVGAAPIAVPGVGLYLSPLAVLGWWMLSLPILRYGQGVSWGRALLATAVLPAIAAVSVTLFIVLVVVPGVQAGVAAAQSRQLNPSRQALALSLAVFTHAQAPGSAGAGPAHMGELLADGTVLIDDVLGTPMFRTDARGSIGGVAFAQWGAVTPSNGAVLKAAVKGMLPGRAYIAHRVGDVVFTYHGINLSAPPDAGVWVLVVTTEPARFGFTPPGQAPAAPALAVVLADGTVTEVADAAFDAALAAQNDLRVQHGLARLPDPRGVVANGFVFTEPQTPPPVADGP